MGLIDDLRNSFNGGRDKARAEAETRRHNRQIRDVRLAEPNYGNLVTFCIDAEEPVLHMYVNQLEALANTLDAESIVSGKNVTIQCKNSIIAEAVRTRWK